MESNTSSQQPSITHPTPPNPQPPPPPMSDSGERRPSRTGPPAPPEQLPCPRCDSTNTKFCYYNNYNLSQPRHFCKSCRRYWTHGGTLRNVPVGGGTRKPSSVNKRRRIDTTPSKSPDGVVSNPGSGLGPGSAAVMEKPDNLSSFWSSGQMDRVGSGGEFLTLHGYGFGFDAGYGVLDWAPESVAEVGAPDWQMGGGADGGGVAEDDYFSWPVDVAVSTPAKSVKVKCEEEKIVNSSVEFLENENQ